MGKKIIPPVILSVFSGLLVILCSLQSNATWHYNTDIILNNSQLNNSQYALFSSQEVNKNKLETNQISLLPESLPTPEVHQLPTKLREWKDINNSGDYFSQIQPVKSGYLVWSQFPIKFYIDTPNLNSNNAAKLWQEIVSNAVNEWGVYLPLEIVNQANIADIQILRKSPPLQFSRDGKPSRVRSAETSFSLYIDKSKDTNILRHRFNILLSPSQSGKYLLAAARHEIGHALGIWGHSPLESDALYFSQVRNPPDISARDVNTLKLVYQQPTSLGWLIEK
ncbi:MAG: peptidase [Cyanobacteria bacterium P01_A01_bin.84]